MTLSINLIAQEELGWVWSVELYLGINGNVPQPNSFTVYLDHVGTVWSSENGCITQYFINTDPDINNTNYPWTFESLEYFRWRGWDCVYSQNTNVPPISAPIFGYGLYKVSTNIPNSAYFYIDYRDTRIPYIEYPHIGDPIDFWIKYDYNDKTFWYSPSPGSPPGNFTQISSGEHLKIWEQKMQYPSPPITAGFPDYWENCLAVIKSGSGHPQCVFGPHPDDGTEIDVEGYKVYRAVTQPISPPPIPIFIQIGIVDDETFEFTDFDFGFGGPLDLHYKVAALYTNMLDQQLETTPTNTVIVGGGLYKQTKQNQLAESSFKLFQNHPNPFNPFTTIYYSISKNSFVSLKLYDVLGNKLAELVNTNKQPGNYSVTFDASGLSSGLYFYQLNAGGYSVTKKMLFQK